MILVDSSAWIEFQRATESVTHSRLRRAIQSREPLATTAMVILEVLAGGRDERQASDLHRLLAGCQFLTPDEPSDSESAADLYRACRREGTTIRRLPDCLIAAVAIRTGCPVLHADDDFDALSRHTALEVVAI